MRRTFLTALLLALFSSATPAAEPSAAVLAQIAALRNSASDAARLAAVKNLQTHAGSVKALVPALSAALRDKYPEVRAAAALALADIGPSARAAAPYLARALNDSDENTRIRVAQALGEIGEPSDAAFCGLVFQLQDQSPAVRARAAEALGKFGPAAAHTIPVLKEALRDSNPQVAGSAALALAALGAVVPEAAPLYVLALNSENHRSAEQALRALGSAGVMAEAQALTDKRLEQYARREAAACLGRMGAEAAPATNALIAALADPDKELQKRAALALLELRAAPAESAPILLRLMQDGGGDLRATVLNAFEKMNGPAATEAAYDALKVRDDRPLRREAARVLARLAPRLKDDPSQVIAALSDEDETVVFLLTDALAKSGAEPEKITDALIAAMNGKGEETPLRACQALTAMRGHPRALAALGEARLKTKASGVRNEAGKAILAAGPGAIAAMPSLLEALLQTDDYLRSWALQALENIGPAASEAIPEVAQCMARFPSYRQEAARTLSAIGEKSIPALLDLLNSTDAGTRIIAASALGQIGAPALPQLLELLHGERMEQAALAALALDKMGAAALPAVPELILATHSKIDNLHSYAQQTLSRLGPLAAPALLAEMKSEDDTARRAAIHTFAQMNGKIVPFLVDALRAERNVDTICGLLDSLSRLGPKAIDSVPLILEIAGRPELNGREEQIGINGRDGPGKARGKIWSCCAAALGNIGGSRDAAVPLLFEILSDTDHTAQSDAYVALTQLAGEDLRVPPISAALRNAPPHHVGLVLKKFGPTGMNALFEELNDSDPLVRDHAATAFVSLLPECVPFLLRQLDAPERRLSAALALGEIRWYESEKRPAASLKHPAASTAIKNADDELRLLLDTAGPRLQALAQGDKPDEAIAALWALVKPLDGGAAGVALVVKNLTACQPSLQPRGLHALKITETARESRAIVPALPLLLKFASDPQAAAADRKDAQLILQSAGYGAESVPALMAALQDGTPPERNMAADALKGLGPTARGAIPLLVGMLERNNNEGYGAATAVLGAIGPEASLALIQALKSENARLREGALNALQNAKAFKLASQLDALTALFVDEREDVCGAALQLIRSLGPDGRRAEAGIRPLLARDSETLFAHAADTLKHIGADVFAALAPAAASDNEDIALRALTHIAELPAQSASNLIPLALRAFKSQSVKIRAAAIALLIKVETPLDGLPLVLEAMNDKSYFVRMRASHWLRENARLSPTKTIPSLLLGLSDDYVKVRGNARRALASLGEDAIPALPEIRKLLDHPGRAIQVEAAAVMIDLGIQDEPRATILHNESRVLEKVSEYFEKQDNFLEAHWTEERVHYFAPAYLQLWGKSAKDFAAQNDPDGVFNFSGYKLKVLLAQGAAAPGGKKSWQVNGLLTGGHALLAWPKVPAETGRTAYLSGPDGTIYERAISAADAARIEELTAEFNPGAEWTVLAKPEKIAPAANHEYFKPKGQESEPLEF